jgi:hypothetical protein
MKCIYRKNIDDIINACTQTLNDNHRHIGNDVGWHQHLGSHKVGIVATAMALLYYQMVNEECPDKEECLEFLKNKKNTDGGWPYISNTNGESNVESTCWALYALYQYDAQLYSKEIEEGTAWLLNQYDLHDDQDSGWPFMKDALPRIYLTAFVLRTLKRLGKDSGQEYESAKRWLIDARNDDGGWGELPERGSSLFFTCYCIMTLTECGIAEDNIIIVNALEWLNRKMSEINMYDSSLICYLEFIEKGTAENRVRIPFFHYVLPYVVMTYLKLGKKGHVVFDAIKVLIERSSKGSIEHPMLENSRIIPIWALYDTVSAYECFKDSFKNWEDKDKFIDFLGRIWGIGKYNLFMPLIRISNWFWKFLVVFVVVYIITEYWKDITSWWGNVQDKTLGQLLISMSATIIIAVGQLIWSFVKKKLETFRK